MGSMFSAISLARAKVIFSLLPSGRDRWLMKPLIVGVDVADFLGHMHT